MNKEADPKPDDVIDIEEYAKEGKEVPKGRRYRIRIDGNKYLVGPTATGRQLLTLAGKVPPEKYRLDQRMRGGHTLRIGLDESVDFTHPGIERFNTMPLEQTDGEVRRQFQLPEEDVEHLDARGLRWETIHDAGGQWLILHDFPTYEGFNHRQANLAIQIAPGYPVAPLDMAYFNPDLVRVDGKPISAVSAHQFDGKNWQRWSRHRTSDAPWRPGIDNIATHLGCVEWWLEREFKRS